MLNPCCNLCSPHTTDRWQAEKVRLRDRRPHVLVKGCVSDVKSVAGQRSHRGLTSGPLSFISVQFWDAVHRATSAFLLGNGLITVQRLKDHQSTSRRSCEKSPKSFWWFTRVSRWFEFMWTDLHMAPRSCAAQFSLSTTQQPAEPAGYTWRLCFTPGSALFPLFFFCFFFHFF